MQEREETMAVDNAETFVKRECRFEKLTPYDGVDIPIYEQAISFALSEKDIRNVAISGAYGSGKSSVLASYEKKHEDKKFIHICLAHFGDEDQEKTPDQKVDEINRENVELMLKIIHCESNEYDLVHKNYICRFKS